MAYALARNGFAFAAGLVGGLWIDTARRTRATEEDHPPAGRFVEVDGAHGPARLHYLERGRGRPVVFLHGNGILAQDWDLCGILGEACRDFQCIAFDRPGHGYSDQPPGAYDPAGQAALLRAGVRALGLEKPILVGHSLGATVALAWALDYPEDVTGVLYLSGFAYPQPRLDLLPFMTSGAPLVGPALSHTVLPPLDRLLLPALLARIFQPDPVPRGYDRLPVDLMLRPSQLEAAGAQTAALIPGVARLAPRYPDLKIPLTIMAGTEDRIVDHRAHALRLHEDVPASTLHLLTGSGHMINHSGRDAVLEALRRMARTDVPALAATL